MVRLRATGRYADRSRGLHYLAGEEFLAEPDEAARLQRDSPGTFAVAETAAVSLAALDGPPVDTMLRRDRVARKDRGGGEAMTRAAMRGLVRG